MYTILTITHYFQPGYKAGGPIRSLANFVEWVSGEFEIKIVTVIETWAIHNLIADLASKQCKLMEKLMYCICHQKNSAYSIWYTWLKTFKYDAIYLNSFFSQLTLKTLLLRRLGLLPDCPVILAR